MDWPAKVDRDGYPSGKLHRRVLEFKLGRALLIGEVTRHRCDNRRCINPDHLEPGTNLDNLADRNARGRVARGNAMPWAKLTPEVVMKIVSDLNAGDSRKTVADRYGVHPHTVCDVAIGRSWTHVTGLPRRRRFPLFPVGMIAIVALGAALSCARQPEELRGLCPSFWCVDGDVP